MINKKIIGIMFLLFICVTSVYGGEIKETKLKTEHVNFYIDVTTQELLNNFYESENVVAVRSEVLTKLKKDDTKTTKAKLEFGCDGGIYKIYKSDTYYTTQNNIIENGDVYGFATCKKGKLSFEVDGFSAFTIIADSTVLYYTMDNADYSFPTVDDIVNGYDGTVTSGVTSGVTGVVNEAIDFSGQTLSVGDTPDLDFDSTESFSYQIWYDFGSIGDEYIFQKKATAGYFLYTYGDGRVQAGARDATGSGCYFTAPAGTASTGGYKHFVYTRNTTTQTATLYVNGVSVGTVTNSDCADDTSNNQDLFIALSGLDATIDEYAMWDRALSPTEVGLLYNSGDGLQHPFEDLTASVNITWVNQTPNNLNFTNAFNGVEIVYNIQNFNTSVDPYLNYTIADDGCPISINGTCLEYPQFVDYNSSSLDNYKFVLTETELLPATYNVEPNYMYFEPKNIFELDNNKDRLKIEFNQVHNDTIFNVFEVNLISGIDQSLAVFYCNSTYVNGKIELGTIPDGCGVLGQIDTTGSYNHQHSNVSGHQNIDFQIINGSIGSVSVTNKSYFIVSGVTTNSMNVSYIDNNSDTIQLSSNEGVSYSSISGTVDAHIHQYHGYENLTYQACVYNASGGVECSETREDGYDSLPSFEELPLVAITNPPEGGTYGISDPLTISWFGFDGDGDVLTYDLYIDSVQIFDDVTNLSYPVDLSMYLGEVDVYVEVCENGSVTRCNDDEITFTVTSETVTTPASTNFSWNVDNPAPVMFSCPTNFMQFVIILFWYAIALFCLFGGFAIKQPFVMLVGSCVWMLNSTFFFGCDEFMGLTLLAIGIFSIVFTLNKKAYKN